MSFLRDVGGKLIPAIPVIGQVYEVARYLHSKELPGGSGPAFGGSSAGASTEDVVASGILTAYNYGVGSIQNPPPLDDEDVVIPPITFPPIGPPYQETGDLESDDPAALLPVPPQGPSDVIEPVTPPGQVMVPPYYGAIHGEPYHTSGDIDVTPPSVDYGPVDPRIFRQRRGRRHTSPDATAPPGAPTMPRGNPSGPYGDKPGMMRPPPRGFIPGQVYGRKVQRRIPRGYTFPTPFPTLPAPEPPRAPDDDETDRERPPLFPPDTEEPANDTSIRRPPQPQVEPVRVPDPAGVRAPFPAPPPRVELPGVPPVTVPRPETPKWPTPSSFPASTPQTMPSSPAVPTVGAPATVPSTTYPSTTFPGSASNAGVRTAVSIAVPIALAELLRLLRGNARTASPSSALSTTTAALTGPELNPFQALPRARTSPATALTPGTATGVESAPSCETPSQTRQRRENQRQDCRRFITVVVPRHHRKVCAAEAGRLLGKKLGRKIGSLVGRKVRGVLKKAGVPLAKLPKRKRIPRSIEIGGGFGVELPRMPGSPR